MQAQTSYRRHPNAICHETASHQFINGEGHINTVSGPVKHLTPSTASTPSSGKRTSVPGLPRDSDVGPFMHSNSILINNSNSNSNISANSHRIHPAESAAVNNLMHNISNHNNNNNSPVAQSKLSIAGPITDL